MDRCVACGKLFHCMKSTQMFLNKIASSFNINTVNHKKKSIYRSNSTVSNNKPAVYQLVLIGGDRCEDGFREDVGPVLFAVQVVHRLVPPLDQVDSGLVPVHRVQHNLQHFKKFLVSPFETNVSLKLSSSETLVCFD